MSSKVSERDVKAVMDHELWAVCDHAGVGPRDHRCGTCGATMRRCCDSSIGMRPHKPGCHAIAAAQAAAATELSAS